jgi:lysozyme
MTPEGRLQLHADEGSRSRAYVDVTGNVSIGVGRNLTGKGLADSEIAMLLSNDIRDAETALAGYTWFGVIEPVRLDVCAMMVFNLGATGFASYRHMQAALAAGDWQGAADQLWDSGAARLLETRYRRFWWAMVTASWSPADWSLTDGLGRKRDASNWPMH